METTASLWFCEFVSALCRLSQLKVLELRENHLKTLPNSLMSLSHLCRLDLGTNDFQQLVIVGVLVIH